MDEYCGNVDATLPFFYVRLNVCDCDEEVVGVENGSLNDVNSIRTDPRTP